MMEIMFSLANLALISQLMIDLKKTGKESFTLDEIRTIAINSMTTAMQKISEKSNELEKGSDEDIDPKLDESPEDLINKGLDKMIEKGKAPTK